MPTVAPYRVAAYVAMAAVLALVGWHSLKSEDPDTGPLPGGAGDGRVDRGNADTGTEAGGGLEFEAGGRRIVVDVSGAVRRPGVYRFDHGQRVIDAIRRAGGASSGAFAAGINRAALLSDGQQVVVPLRAGVAPSGGGAGAASAAGSGGAGAAVDAPISLGSATQAELEEIEGIGPVTAQSILEFRDSEGGISSVDELDQVSGIGPVTMEALRARLQP